MIARIEEGDFPSPTHSHSPTHAHNVTGVCSRMTHPPMHTDTQQERDRGWGILDRGGVVIDSDPHLFL